MDGDPTWTRLATMVAAASDAAVDPIDIRPDSRLVDELGLSSLEAVTLMVDLEQAFDIVVREEGFDHLETAGDLKQVIDRRRSGAP
jgi:acyl carrier protein